MKKALEVVEGTFLVDVFNIIEKGEFTKIDLPLKEGEEVIGEMIPFEKGLATYLFSLSKKEKEIVEYLKKMVVVGNGKGAEFETKANELKAVRDNFEAAKGIMWNSVKNRMNVWHSSIGFGSNYKIFKFEAKKGDCDCPACQAKEAFERLNEGISVIYVGSRAGRG